MIEEEDTHEKFIRACQEYLKWQGRFEYKGSDEAGIKARNALLEVKKLSMKRREEIQIKRQERKKLRNAKNGRPFNITKQSYK
jgi:hypothetical protein